ncbi:MAG: hypothetical protein F4Z01_09005 [Gammaproteobacteria bacterium]|nr:hypothetical protein [Gammaproteobacteria bacterium]MYF38884.1 hypothetical protein [Gammaproteobacteria bacterium]
MNFHPQFKTQDPIIRALLTLRTWFNERMGKSFGMAILLLSLFFTSSIIATKVPEPAEEKDFGDCIVREYRIDGSDADRITQVTLSCRSRPQKEEESAWMSVYANPGTDKNVWSLLPIVAVKHSEDSIKVRYYFDDEDQEEDIFKFHDYSSYTYASKEIDDDELNSLITDIEGSEKFEFNFEGKTSSITTISFDESAKKAVSDFRERFKLLREQEDPIQKE